jgi:hypothetical protein
MGVEKYLIPLPNPSREGREIYLRGETDLAIDPSVKAILIQKDKTINVCKYKFIK